MLLWIALGGAVGAVSRYLVSGWVTSLLDTTLPWGTFVVNVLGSFLLGFLFRTVEVSLVSPEMRAMLAIGLLGAFTTFSTFSLEAVALVQEGAWLRASSYVLGSVFLGIAGVLVGISLASTLIQLRA
jgi:fluoride exporter